MAVSAVSGVGAATSPTTALAVPAATRAVVPAQRDGGDTPSPRGSVAPSAPGTSELSAHAAAGAQAPSAAQQHRTPSDQDAQQDSAAAQATDAYLQQLFVAHAVGSHLDASARPAQITPERLTALVDYLQGQLSPRASSDSPAVVDTTG